MYASIFKSYVDKYFPALLTATTAKVNGDEKGIQVIHKGYLKDELSLDMKWAAISSDTNIVAADIVDLNSTLPLKQRGSHTTATGEVPKLGLKKAMNATQLQQLKSMQALGKKEADIVKILFNDTLDGVQGIYERLDIMFLQALSTGATLVGADTNVGTAVRLNFNIPKDNFFNPIVANWSKPTATPIEDIENIISEARGNGHQLSDVFIDQVDFRNLRQHTNFKSAFAGYSGVLSDVIKRVSEEDAISFFRSELRLNVHIIDKVARAEVGGQNITIEPWQRGNVTFTTTNQVGRLIYSELAEQDDPVPGVEYYTADKYILVSRYRAGDPLRETTSVQALAVPVLQNTESIYILNTEDAIEVDSAEVEGDANITIGDWGTFAKATVIEQFNALEGVSNTTSTVGDAKLIERINALSDEDQETLKTALGA